MVQTGLEVQDTVFQQPLHPDLVDAPGKVGREGHLGEDAGASPVAQAFDELACRDIGRLEAADPTQDREGGPDARMHEDPGQPARAPAHVEHGVAHQGTGAHLEAGGAQLRPGCSPHTVDELRTGLHGLAAEVADRVDAPADAIACLDDAHREPSSRELPRSADPRHAGADHDDVLRGGLLRLRAPPQRATLLVVRITSQPPATPPSQRPGGTEVLV